VVVAVLMVKVQVRQALVAVVVRVVRQNYLLPL
jgi:hypothetical protein